MGIEKLGKVWGDFHYQASKSPTGIKNEAEFSKNILALRDKGKLDKLQNLQYIKNRLSELIKDASISNTNKLIAVRTLNNALGFEMEGSSDLKTVSNVFMTNIGQKIKEAAEARTEIINKLIGQVVDPILEEKTKEVNASLTSLLSVPTKEIIEKNNQILIKINKEVRNLFRKYHVRTFNELPEDQQEIIRSSQERGTPIAEVDFLIKNIPDGMNKEKVMALIWLNVLRQTGNNLYKKMHDDRFHQIEKGVSVEDVMEFTKRETITCELWNYSPQWGEHAQDILSLAYCRNSEEKNRRVMLEGHRLCYLSTILLAHPNRKEEAVEILKPLEAESETGQTYIKDIWDEETQKTDIDTKVQLAILKKFKITFSTMKSTSTLPTWMTDALK